MDYLFKIVFGNNNIEKSRKPVRSTPSPFSSKPQQNCFNSSKQNKKSNINTHNYYNEYHKFHKSSFNKAKFSTTKSHNHNHKMPPSAYTTFHPHTSAFAAATMNSPNNNSSSNKTPQSRRVIDSEHRYRIVDDICGESNLYNILGVERTCSTEELRRAYI